MPTVTRGLKKSYTIIKQIHRHPCPIIPLFPELPKVAACPRWRELSRDQLFSRRQREDARVLFCPVQEPGRAGPRQHHTGKTCELAHNERVHTGTRAQDGSSEGTLHRQRDKVRAGPVTQKGKHAPVALPAPSLFSAEELWGSQALRLPLFGWYHPKQLFWLSAACTLWMLADS